MSGGSPRLAPLRGFFERYGWLALAAAALLVLTRTVDFSPPPQVRPDPSRHGGAAGPVAVPEFSADLRSPQVLQLRAVLRRYDDPSLPVAADDRALDDRGDVLSSPLLTAVVGTEAAVDQKVRLEGGDLELAISLRATPRLGPAGDTRLEHALQISSKRQRWSGASSRTVLAAHGVLGDIPGQSARWVFTVDAHLFSLDLEAVQPPGPV